MRLASMVLSPGPACKLEDIPGTGPTAVTNFLVKAQDGIVKVEAWRDTAEYARELKASQIYYFEGIKKVAAATETSKSVARYQKFTSHDA